MTPHPVVILIDHGSRSSPSNQSLARLADLVARKLALVVRTAHLTLEEPSLETAVSTAATEGVRQIVVAPCFLSDGQHAGRDIPAMVSSLRAAYSEISIQLADPLGVDDLLAELVAKRVRPHLPCRGEE